MRAWLVGGHIVWVLNVTAYQLSLDALRVIFRMYRTSVRCDFAQDILFFGGAHYHTWQHVYVTKLQHGGHPWCSRMKILHVEMVSCRCSPSSQPSGEWCHLKLGAFFCLKKKASGERRRLKFGRRNVLWSDHESWSGQGNLRLSPMSSAVQWRGQFSGSFVGVADEAHWQSNEQPQSIIRFGAVHCFVNKIAPEHSATW